MKAIDRLYEYLDCKKIKPTNLEKELGLSNGYFSIQKKRKADIGESTLKKITEYCRDLNPVWLLTGESEMLKNEDFERKTQEYLEKPAKEEELLSKAFTWLICASYSKKKNSDFSFNSFNELSQIFKAASDLMQVWQSTLEADVFSEVVLNLKNNTELDNEGNFVIDDSVANVLDKYISVYESLKSVSSDLMITLKNKDITQEVLKKNL